MLGWSPCEAVKELVVALEMVGAMLECFAASSGGRKVTLNLYGQTGVA